MIVEVYKFKMGDVEDPDLYAAQSLRDFETSEKGRWIMKNTFEPKWNRNDYINGWQYTITTEMTEEQYIYYKLKYE